MPIPILSYLIFLVHFQIWFTEWPFFWMLDIGVVDVRFCNLLSIFFITA